MKYLLMLMSILILSSCKYSSTFSQLKNLKSSKDEVEVISTQELNSENQAKLRVYFSTIKDIAYEFMNNSKMQKYTHKKFTKYFEESICNDVLLGDSFYAEVMKKCTVNGFYICSEEVKSYKELLGSIKNLFNKKEIEHITRNSKCENKLKNLGVINE